MQIWFDHVQRRVINAPVRKRELIQVERTRKGRGRPKITLIEVERDMLVKKETKSMTLDIIEW
jgi:hypothetical protein